LGDEPPFELVQDLDAEIRRVEGAVARFEATGFKGMLGAKYLRDAVERGKDAAISGSITEMEAALNYLKCCADGPGN
jgi:hypothetical protein